MLIDDYRPMKRLGVEELDGLVNMLEQRIGAAAFDEPTPRQWRDEGAWLALHLLLTGRFDTPDTFLAVFDVKCEEIFGKGD